MGNFGKAGDSIVVEVMPPWPKCQYWLRDKQRYCRMEKFQQHAFYCAEHIPWETSVVGVDGVEMKRIPCPNDDSHSCFKHLLEKHLAKCNSKKLSIFLSYIENDVNKLFEPRSNMAFESSPAEKEHHGIKYLEMGQLNQYNGPCTYFMTNEVYSKLMEKVVRIHCERGCWPLVEEYALHPSLCQELCRSDVGDNATKHLAQIGSIVSLLESEDLLKSNTAFIEFGGGRGSITYHLAKIVADKKLKGCKFFIIDKISPRHKLDNKLKEWGINVTRIRADIKDVLLGGLPGIDYSVDRIVGVAKHLCGNATDMALFSLLSPLSNTRADMVAGFCFASCCHHKCIHESYAGSDFVKELFTPEEFEVLPVISSWATCGNPEGRLDDDDKVISESTVKFFENIQKAYPHYKFFLKETIGNFAKNILDHGRAEFSKTNGIGARVVYFTDQVTTLENRAIIGSKKETQQLQQNLTVPSE